ncbi:hypothetical protein JCM6294_1434 [Bacteroides pyogenes DSM 20611 = JCM 6294]|uniref:Uncharacterized protein n=1 Tax=Bacteroides pyogenes DSM 20611 = JCM 6294 TaxID=1121100 RepID=W4PFE5_9BACE|nr:hypothetical protein [Bacteroides pyogenes]GAE18526.1 hypothetical protein JCM6294_1434 [Bacteroides pyogenes DSM 20611 = JCM 6294]
MAPIPKLRLESEAGIIHKRAESNIITQTIKATIKPERKYSILRIRPLKEKGDLNIVYKVYIISIYIRQQKQRYKKVKESPPLLLKKMQKIPTEAFIVIQKRKKEAKRMQYSNPLLI